MVEYDDHNPAMCVHHCPLEGVRHGARQEVMTYLRHRAGHVVPVRLWTMALKNRAGDIVGAVKVLDCFDDFRHGHGMEAGSAIIREVARTLKDMVRRSDMVGRWSADGFLGIPPGCGIEPLGRVAARMRRVGSRVASPWWGDRLSLNVSAKITIIERGDTLESMEARLRAAEEVPELAAKSTGA